MNEQETLALLLVDELRRQGALEKVLGEYMTDSMRVCETCGRLMNEGWIVGGNNTYCSDECLLAAHPDEDIRQLEQDASEDWSDTYWTRWET